MLKRKFFILFLVCFFLLPFSSSALISDDLTNHEIVSTYFYPSTWNNLVMDFTVFPDFSGSSEDYLEAFTLRNAGNVRNAYDLSAVKLWSDNYTEGWQGWSHDNYLATAEYYNGSWYFDNLNLKITADGLRLFITVDVNYSLISEKSIFLFIPELDDDNNNGDFNLGDQGIFFTSGNNGPTDGDFSTINIQRFKISTMDFWPPQAIISNLSNNQTLEGISSYIITGQAKDQGRSAVDWVKVGIGSNENNLTWRAAENTGVDYSTWSYQWQDITPGSYILKTQSRDSSGNLSEISPAITVKIIALEETVLLAEGTLVRESAAGSIYLIKDGKKLLLPGDAIFNSWGYSQSEVVEADLSGYSAGDSVGFRDGYLVKGSAPEVYVISEGKKRWITSGEIFTSLGYSWNKVNLISDEMLGQYPDGSVLNNTYTHPAGTLIKYLTYPEVFLIENGYRRHIADEETFLGRGYYWDNIITLPDWEYYPTGEEIGL